MRYNDHIDSTTYCNRCLLDSNSASVDSDGICDMCHLYDQKVDVLNGIFGLIGTLPTILKKQNNNQYDCILLYSGGKDSTYALLKLRALNYEVLAYTFDNGYLSTQALENIKSITTTLGVDSIIETFPEIDAVFSESLKIFSTVCDGCFKVLVTLSTKLAIERGIPAIVSGLSRGQIIETKLKPFLQRGIILNMDDYLSEQRKVYHYWDNHFSGLIESPGSPTDIDHINFIDYFFYDDASDEEILRHIEESGYWKKSCDTGFCSTNCRINDAGTVAFIRDNGYHNYAAPLSWDVRLDRMTKEDALAKITTSKLNTQQIEAQLSNFGVMLKPKIEDCHVTLLNDKLIAFIQSPRKIDVNRLQDFIREELPSYMIPHRFVTVGKFPLLENEKIDYPTLTSIASSEAIELTHCREGPYIEEISRIWSSLLGHSDFGDDDSFFDVGGDSLEAVMMAVEIDEKLDCTITFEEILDKLTINGIANQIKRKQGEFS